MKELKKIIDESKKLLKTIKKNDENKKYTSADEVLKRLNAEAEDIKKTNEALKEYYTNEAQKELEAEELDRTFKELINKKKYIDPQSRVNAMKKN